MTAEAKEKAIKVGKVTVYGAGGVIGTGGLAGFLYLLREIVFYLSIIAANTGGMKEELKETHNLAHEQKIELATIKTILQERRP